MKENEKYAGISYMNNVLECIIANFMNYRNEDLNRESLAAILRTVKRFEKNIRQRQLEKGYIKIKTYASREEKEDSLKDGRNGKKIKA